MKVNYKLFKVNGVTKLSFRLETSTEEDSIMGNWWEEADFRDFIEVNDLGRDISQRIKNRYKCDLNTYVFKLVDFLTGRINLTIAFKKVKEEQLKELSDRISEFFENRLLKAVKYPEIDKVLLTIEIPEDIKTRIQDKFFARYGTEPDISIIIKAHKNLGACPITFSSILNNPRFAVTNDYERYSKIQFINENDEMEKFEIDFLSTQEMRLFGRKFGAIENKNMDDLINSLKVSLANALQPKFNDLMSILDLELQYNHPLNVAENIDNLFSEEAVNKYPFLNEIKVDYTLQRKSLLSYLTFEVNIQYPVGLVGTVSPSKVDHFTAPLQVTTSKYFMLYLYRDDLRYKSRIEQYPVYYDEKPVLKRRNYYSLSSAMNLVRNGVKVVDITNYEDRIIADGVATGIRDAVIELLIKAVLIPDVYSSGLMKPVEHKVIKEDYGFLEALAYKPSKKRKNVTPRTPRDGVLFNGFSEMSKETRDKVAPIIVEEKLKANI